MLISFKDVLTKNQIMIDSDTVRELIADEQGTDFQVHAEICHKLEIYYVSKEDYFRIINNNTLRFISEKSSDIKKFEDKSFISLSDDALFFLEKE